jgi:RNA polymerase sigma factor (sigma-70 family)
MLEQTLPNQESDGFLQKLKAHDVDSLSELFDIYGEKVYRLAFRMTGNHQDAADISQETFARVIQHIDSFRGESHLYTWIFTIAKHSCYRHYENKRRITFQSYEEMLVEASDVKIPNPLSELEKSDLTGQVKEGCLTGLIRCLSLDQRTAFILHVFLDLSIFDIALIMERSEGAVKVLIHRARKNLKSFLCKNCSVYDSSNPCKCENMVDFSLKQGWIKPGKNSETLNTTLVEEEIDQFKKIINFYTNLADPVPPSTVRTTIRGLYKKMDWLIFQS